MDAAASFNEAPAAATASGDGRMAATVRLNLARLHQSTCNGAATISPLRENLEWYDNAGGGDGALVSRCVLAAQTDDRGSRREEKRHVRETFEGSLRPARARKGMSITQRMAHGAALHPWRVVTGWDLVLSPRTCSSAPFSDLRSAPMPA